MNTQRCYMDQLFARLGILISAASTIPVSALQLLGCGCYRSVLTTAFVPSVGAPSASPQKRRKLSPARNGAIVRVGDDICQLVSRESRRNEITGTYLVCVEISQSNNVCTKYTGRDSAVGSLQSPIIIVMCIELSNAEMPF